MRNASYTLLFIGVLALSACGQAPSFVDATTGGLRGHDSGSGSGSGGGESSGDQTANPGSDGAGGEGSGSGGSSESGGGGAGGSSGGGASTGESPATPPYVVPGANPADTAAINRCLAKWKNHPFPTNITSFKHIYAAISINSNAVVVDDVAQTAVPQLILVDAGVAVGGNPIYNLRNQNGYYCMKVGVNVKTNLTINLACKARLADSLFQVGVNSSSSGTSAAVGINVGSNVKVNTTDVNGQPACHQ